MRVYEFSRETGVSSKELIKLLSDEGFNIPSHMSLLTEENISFLKKKLQKDSLPAGKTESLKTTKTENKETSNKVIQKEKQVTANPIINFQPEAAVSTESKQLDLENQKPKNHQKKSEVKKEEEKKVIILSSMTVGDLADRIGVPSGEIILNLLKRGLLLNKNQVIKEDIVEQIAKQHGLEVVMPNLEAKVVNDVKLGLKEQKHRPPIVVVMGHVDHGKTTLLDFIRKTRVVAKEKGGITQHLGAYEVSTPNGKIIFLDTPGHEAFTKMRQRGIKSADIAILVVAADDGVMPQTVEAIKQAQSADVPIIVAINKVDKVPAAKLEDVKAQLAKYELLTEDWGGQTLCVPISAKLGQGIDQLLEMVLLQAEIMELKSDETIDACGYVLESKIEKGLGPVATFIAQHGSIKIGDFFVCGDTQGKVTVLIDSAGNRMKSVGPAIPVQVAGFDSLAQAGDYLQVVTQQEYYKIKEAKLERKDLYAIKEIPVDAIKVIIKADVASSKEALVNTIEKLSKKSEKKIYIVHAGMGNVTETDVMLAADTKATIYAFSVKPEAKILALAQRYSVPVKIFYVIYHLLDDIAEVIKSEKKIEYKRVKSGEAIVRKVFDIKDLGVIAGFYVKDGKILKDGIITIFRANRKIGQGTIKSLQRDKKNMKEVAVGFEGAMIIDGFKDWAVDDRIECSVDVAQI